MPKTLTDIAIEKELQDCSDEEKALIFGYSRKLNENRDPNAERSSRLLSLRNHVIMISTFPFALSLMVISTPLMIPGVVNVASFALLLGTVGLWLAKRRGIRVEKRFLALMLLSFGISTAFIAPLLALGATSYNLSVPLAASLLYGITLAIFLVISFGFYGIVVNLQKPQRELAGA